MILSSLIYSWSINIDYDKALVYVIRDIHNSESNHYTKQVQTLPISAF